MNTRRGVYSILRASTGELRLFLLADANTSTATPRRFDLRCRNKLSAACVSSNSNNQISLRFRSIFNIEHTSGSECSTLFTQTIRWGADVRQTSVETTANVVKPMRQRRSITMAANRHSLIISLTASSRRNRLVINLSSVRISFISAVYGSMHEHESNGSSPLD